MANIPVNPGGTFLFAGQSATGSFAGMLALSTGSVIAPTGSQIVALKYINGYAVVSDGKGFQNYIPTETTISTVFNLNPGTKIDLVITSCSLAAGSAPVILYT
jgi:hypothetical protein